MSLPENTTIGHEMLKAARWHIITTVTNYGALLFSIIILARFLGADEYGSAAIVLSIGAFFVLCSQFGFAQAIVANKDVDKEFIDTIFTVSFILACFFYIFLFFISSFLGDLYGNVELPLFLQVNGVGIFLSLGMAIPISVLQRKLDFKSQTIVSLWNSFSMVLTGIILAVLGFGVWALIIPALVGNFTGMTAAYILSGYRPSFAINVNKLKKAMNFGISAFIANISHYICGNIVPVVMGKIWSTAVLGYFSFSETKYSKPFDLISAQLVGTFFPIIGKVSDDVQRVKNAFLRITRLAFFVIPPVYILLLFGAPLLFTFFFGEQWIISVLIFQIFCLVPILRSFLIAVSPTLYALQAPEVAAKLLVWRVFVYLAAFFVFYILHSSLVEVVITVVCIDILYMGVYLMFCLKKIRCSIIEFLSFMRMPFIMNIVMFLMMFIVMKALGEFFTSAYINFIVSSIFAFTIFIVIGWHALANEWRTIRSKFS